MSAACIIHGCYEKHISLFTYPLGVNIYIYRYRGAVADTRTGYEDGWKKCQIISTHTHAHTHAHAHAHAHAHTHTHSQIHT